LRTAWGAGTLVAQDLALPHLAAVLEKCAVFLGHDSGISHLAAACGVPCLLFFGPTDPETWAPANPQVQIFAEPMGDLAELTFRHGWAGVEKFVRSLPARENR
jgi:heptosyltransferase-3